MKELTKRILFAVPAALLFLFLTWMGGAYFKTLIILIGFFILKEMMNLMDRAGNITDAYFPYTIGLWVMLYPVLPYFFEIGMIILLLFIAIQTVDTSEESINKLSSSFFAGMYAPAGLLCLMLIRETGTDQTGFLLTVATMFMIWGSDVFAYFGGRTFGKRKLAPAISPNKTWEGFFSGYVGCFIGLMIALYSIPSASGFNLKIALPLVLLTGTFGPIGDLIESKIKRKANVKDSSNLLPGHGGFFDRFDAVLMVAPAVYIYLQFIQKLAHVSF